MIPLALAGAGLGALRSISDKNQEAADTRQRINEIRYSPWTGMNISNIAQVKHPSTLGTIAGGATSAAQLGSDIGQADAVSGMNNAKAAYYKSLTPQAAAEEAPAEEQPQQAAQLGSTGPMNAYMSPGQGKAYDANLWLSKQLDRGSYA